MQFPYPYFFYGSSDSIDKDVIISIPSSLMPIHQEERKQFVKSLELTYECEWNSTLAVIEEGHIIDTIYPKTWIDSLNNALYSTYHLHNQKYDLPIKSMMNRNILLSIYRCVRTVLNMITRTHYRPIVRPYMKGIHDFKYKLDALSKIDFHSIPSFEQKNCNDIDTWKIIAFYIGQNLSLLQNQIEIYTKKVFIKHHPLLSPFIYRKNLTKKDITVLNEYVKIYLLELEKFNFECDKNIMTYKNEKIDMLKEIYL